MPSYDIAFIPGDGVGTEVSEEATKISMALADKYGFQLKIETFGWGCDYYLQHGEMMPTDILEQLKTFDAIFLGCVGDANKVPDHISLVLILTIRKGFDQYVNLRRLIWPLSGRTPRANMHQRAAFINWGLRMRWPFKRLYSPKKAASA